jgi:hypothetical protein
MRRSLRLLTPPIFSLSSVFGPLPKARSRGYEKGSSLSLLRSVPEGNSDRSLAQSAWDTAASKEPSRRARYDSCRCAHRFDDWNLFGSES